MEMHNGEKCKFSINSGCIKKIPLNPPLQKGEGSECPDLITDRFGKHFAISQLSSGGVYP
jgi:hypothetical protein